MKRLLTTFPLLLALVANAATTNTVDIGAAAATRIANATNLASIKVANTNIVGVIPIGNIATGTPTGSKFVRDDGTLATPPAGDITAAGQNNLSGSNHFSGPVKFTGPVEIENGNADSTVQNLTVNGTFTGDIGGTNIVSEIGDSVIPSTITRDSELSSYATTTQLTAATNGTVAKALAATHATNYWGQVNVTNFNSGTGASSSTFWRGDGTWGTPSGAGDVTTAQLQAATNNPAQTWDSELLVYQLGNSSLSNLFGRTVVTNGHSVSLILSNDFSVYGNSTFNGTVSINSPNSTSTIPNLVVSTSLEGAGVDAIVATLQPTNSHLGVLSGLLNGLVKGTPASTYSAAVAGTDYVVPTGSVANATNLYNANLPVPTNSPSIHSRVVATSASTAAWVVGDLVATNTTGAVDFAVPMSEFETNDVPQLLLPANVNVNRYTKSTIFITNSLALYKPILLPAGVRTNSPVETFSVTNMSVVTVYCVGGRWTNAIAKALW